jgi:hypothetical protein
VFSQLKAHTDVGDERIVGDAFNPKIPRRGLGGASPGESNQDSTTTDADMASS